MVVSLAFFSSSFVLFSFVLEFEGSRKRGTD